MAIISDPYGKVVGQVKSQVDGIIIGKQNIPLAQEGEAMYHIAYLGHSPRNKALKSEVQHIQLKTEDVTEEWVDEDQ